MVNPFVNVRTSKVVSLPDLSPHIKPILPGRQASITLPMRMGSNYENPASITYVQDPRERVLRAIQTQVNYLRHKPDSRLRIIRRLEALRRVISTEAYVQDDSDLGQLLDVLRKRLPSQIMLLKADSKNDENVAESLAQVVTEVPLLGSFTYPQNP